VLGSEVGNAVPNTELIIDLRVKRNRDCLLTKKDEEGAKKGE